MNIESTERSNGAWRSFACLSCIALTTLMFCACQAPVPTPIADTLDSLMSESRAPVAPEANFPKFNSVKQVAVVQGEAEGDAIAPIAETSATVSASGTPCASGDCQGDASAPCNTGASESGADGFAPNVGPSTVGPQGETLPNSAYTGASSDIIPGTPRIIETPAFVEGEPPYGIETWPLGKPWQPPGIAGPWPREEYLRDGGDFETPAKAHADFRVTGLEQEDAIVHFDTVDGRRLVQPSNRVHIYAPRFGAVRQVQGIAASKRNDRLAGFELPMKLNEHDETLFATTSMQPLQPIGQIGTKAASAYRERAQAGAVVNPQHLAGFQDAFLPFENFQVIRLGSFDQAEKARLAINIQAAVTWTSDQAVQVIVKGQLASELVGERRPESVYSIKEREGVQIRLIKVASRETARPGETVDFTLRFDNIGQETLGNVTILDNLSTRLEYVPETSQCNVEHEFVSADNRGGSQALRWEITPPLEPGEGGIIRFRTLVR